MRRYSAIYLAFVQHAFQYDTRRFHNFMSYDRKWLDDVGSEDSHGRALQALAAGVRFGNFPDACNELFLYAMHISVDFKSPRAWAYSMVGLRDYVAATNHLEARELMRVLATRLKALFKDCADCAAWPWPEQTCTYDNAILPQALICCGALMNDGEMRELGERALKWLFDSELSGDKFSPIGNLGGFSKTGQHAQFDQQSIEAGSMVMSCVSALHATNDKAWYTRARVAFDWYMGRNVTGTALYDPLTGGCYDALHETRVNRNMGAESLLMFLQGLAAVKAAEREVGDVVGPIGKSVKFA